jgi:hypothetical protein
VPLEDKDMGLTYFKP